jgi:hypothetical protein
MIGYQVDAEKKGKNEGDADKQARTGRVDGIGFSGGSAGTNKSA